VSVNIMLGPGPSSVATRVMGTGFEENFGVEAWRDREGRWEATEEGLWGSPGRDVEAAGFGGVSCADEGRLEEASFREEVRLETVDCFLFVVSGDKIISGADAEGRLPGEMSNACVVLDCVGKRRLLGLSGTLISFSPVDFFDGGGPRRLSPWLRLRINLEVS